MRLPEGTVTFLLTDIENSTHLWEQHPEQMAAALARHDGLAAKIICQHEGMLVKSRGEGDSLFAAFERAIDAVMAACALQQAFLTEAWPAETPLRVRMALHTGETEEREGDYYGVAVNRCARLRSIAHGGQVLLSLATEELVREHLPAEVGIHDLGLHHLRDLTHPEQVFQLLHPALPADFPPLHTLDTLLTNLSLPLTSFIGREKERQDVKSLLSQTRLLTLTGAGGCGKTRLALQVAAEVLEAYPDGVWLVELAGLTDPELVPQALASVFGLREEPGCSLVDTLVNSLQAQKLLLVLDNCEHLLPACSRLCAGLEHACPLVQILATSRERINLPGEITYRVPSLSVPEASHLPPVEQLSRYEAIQLFTERAAEACPEFVLTPQNAEAVVQICRRLDGIPLAIELAAARVRALSLEQIAKRLDDRFHLLTGGSHSVLARQQTLQATLDWSYNLLSPPECLLLHRLSVFAGGWTLEAAEQVCSGAGIDEAAVMDLLTSLVDKSLVLFEERQVRYQLLETVRQYARDRLREQEEERTFRARHQDWFLALAEEADPRMDGPEATIWFDRLETERDNLRLALDFCWEDDQDGEAGVRLAVALWRFWEVRGSSCEGRRHFAAALSHPGVQGQTTLRRWALNGAAALASMQADYSSARALHEESLAISRELGDKGGIANALEGLGLMTQYEGDSASARALLEETLAIRRELGGQYSLAYALGNLGNVVKNQGEYAAARTLWEEALAIFKELGCRQPIAHMLMNMGDVALAEGEYASARALYAESLSIKQVLGNRWGLAESLESFARLTAAQNHLEQSLRLWGAAQALREEIEVPIPPREQEERDRQMVSARAMLGEEVFAAVWKEGRLMTMEQAVAFALQDRNR